MSLFTALASLRRDWIIGGLFLSLLVPLAWTQEEGPVHVTFINANQYVDAGSGPAEVRDNLQELENTLRALGRHALNPGQRLRIDVTEVDLAGRIPVAIGQPNPPRLLTGAADWPRIDLHYTLIAADGQVLQAGNVSLDDKAYLQHPRAAQGNERLRYEKRLLAQWIERQFGPLHRAAATDR